METFRNNYDCSLWNTTADSIVLLECGYHECNFGYTDKRRGSRLMMVLARDYNTYDEKRGMDIEPSVVLSGKGVLLLRILIDVEIQRYVVGSSSFE